MISIPSQHVPDLAIFAADFKDSHVSVLSSVLLIFFNAIRHGDIFDAHTRASPLNAVTDIFKGSLDSEEICSLAAKVSLAHGDGQRALWDGNRRLEA